jgi:hypothetical protein
MANKDDKYLKEAQKVDYGIRSVFFHRDIKGRNYEEFLRKIGSLKLNEYEWSGVQQIGKMEKLVDEGVYHHVFTLLRGI